MRGAALACRIDFAAFGDFSFQITLEVPPCLAGSGR
jgi:hypothetical protein